MTAAAIVLCVLCQVFLVSGQLFFKHAMSPGTARGRMVINLFLGVGTQALWFFLWLGILEKWDLSRVFPFEGLNPVLLVLGAWALLKEHVPATAWVGIGLIGGGIALVSGS